MVGTKLYEVLEHYGEKLSNWRNNCRRDQWAWTAVELEYAFEYAVDQVIAHGEGGWIHEVVDHLQSFDSLHLIYIMVTTHKAHHPDDLGRMFNTLISVLGGGDLLNQA